MSPDWIDTAAAVEIFVPVGSRSFRNPVKW